MGATREDVINGLKNLQEQGPSNVTQQSNVSNSLQPALDVVADFNTGLANLAGIAGTADELFQSFLGVKNPDSVLPTISEIRETGSSIGATRAPGVEADSVVGRFAEELGAGAIPFAGAAAKTSIPLIRLAGAELTSAAGATGGGIMLENSPSFKNDPYTGRAIGELLGGLSAVSLVDYSTRLAKNLPGGTVRTTKKVIDGAVDQVRGRGARRRAAQRGQDVTLSPETALGRVNQPTDVDIEAGVTTPATIASDPGLNRLTAAVMDQDPDSAEELARAFSGESQRLRQLALGSGDPDRVREFLDAKLMEAGTRLDSSLKSIQEGAGAAESSTRAKTIIDNAYNQARAAERRMWRSTPDNITINNPSAKQAWASILRETTTETGKRRLPSVLKREFGSIDKKSGRLKGGSLPKNPSTKQMHELYSELGDIARSEADKAGGSAKTIRILKNVRRSILDDLASVDGGERYKKAVNVSRQLNDRFTKGTVGSILGFSSRGTGSNTTETLDVILRTSGQGRANAIKDIIKSSPQTSEQVQEYIRDLFVQKSVNLNNNRLNSDQARKFFSDNEAVLDQFPELRSRLSNAIGNQDEVDSLVGRSNISDLSIYQRQKSGAGAYLQENPGAEAERILGVKKGRRKLVSDLVETVKEDPSGDAFEGLKTSFVESMINRAGSSGVVDEFTGQDFISGQRLKNIIDSSSSDLVEGGLFTKEEITRLKTVANRLANIESTLKARPPKGGIISDAPNQILSTIARIGGAQAGRVTASRLGGGTVQTPGIFSGQAKRLIERMTNDEARNILVRAVKDKDVMQDLLKNPERLTADRQFEIVDSLLRPIRSTAAIMPSITARGAATAAQRDEQQQQRRKTISRLKTLQSEEKQ
jgi:hypothetical protein